MNKIFSALVATIFLMMSCSKAPEYPVEPQIEFKSISKLRTSFRSDSVRVVISFTDGDGDIGTPEMPSDTSTLTDAFVIDSKNGVVANFFRLHYVPKRGATKGINGEIAFNIYTSCCSEIPSKRIPCVSSDEYPLDTLNYQIIIKDRAGNKSNSLQLPPIELICNQ